MLIDFCTTLSADTIAREEDVNKRAKDKASGIQCIHCIHTRHAVI